MTTLSRDGRFVVPRRFAEVFQMSQDQPGTIDQQVAIREALAAEFGSVQHRFLKLLDADVNKRAPVGSGGRTYIPITVTNVSPFLALAFNNTILMDDNLAPGSLASTMRHEIWHVYDGRIMTWDDRTWFMEMHSPDTEWGPGDRDWRHFNEFFADEGARAWVDPSHYLWARLLP